MRKCLLFWIALLAFSCLTFAFDRQPGTDYHSRRETLTKKAGGVVVLFAPLPGADAKYGFRQDDNFYYLSGGDGAWSCRGHRPSYRGQRECPGPRLYRNSLSPSSQRAAGKIYWPEIGCGESRCSEDHRLRSCRRDVKVARGTLQNPRQWAACRLYRRRFRWRDFSQRGAAHLSSPDECLSDSSGRQARPRLAPH